MERSNTVETAVPDTRARAEELLRAYPLIAQRDLDFLLEFLARGSILDIGHILGNPELKAVVERVKAEHPAPFRTGMAQHLLHLALIILPMLVIGWYAWDYGVR